MLSEDEKEPGAVQSFSSPACVYASVCIFPCNCPPSIFNGLPEFIHAPSPLISLPNQQGFIESLICHLLWVINVLKIHFSLLKISF